jgi:hypothetical protein
MQSGAARAFIFGLLITFRIPGARDAPFKTHAAVRSPEFRNSFSAKFDHNGEIRKYRNHQSMDAVAVRMPRFRSSKAIIAISNGEPSRSVKKYPTA